MFLKIKAESPKMNVNYILLKKKFFRKTFGHGECSFDNSAETFSPMVRKNFAQGTKNSMKKSNFRKNYFCLKFLPKSKKKVSQDCKKHRLRFRNSPVKVREKTNLILFFEKGHFFWKSSGHSECISDGFAESLLEESRCFQSKSSKLWIFIQTFLIKFFRTRKTHFGNHAVRYSEQSATFCLSSKKFRENDSKICSPGHGDCSFNYNAGHLWPNLRSFSSQTTKLKVKKTFLKKNESFSEMFRRIRGIQIWQMCSTIVSKCPIALGSILKKITQSIFCSNLHLFP